LFLFYIKIIIIFSVFNFIFLYLLRYIIDRKRRIFKFHIRFIIGVRFHFNFQFIFFSRSLLETIIIFIHFTIRNISRENGFYAFVKFFFSVILDTVFVS